MTREIDITPAGEYTRLPWAYRPNKHDDWGMIRGADGFPVASTYCLARHPDSWQRGDTEHNDIGPPEVKANAEFIVRACNTHEALVSACECALIAMTEDVSHEDAAIEMCRAILARIKRTTHGPQSREGT